MTGRKQKEVTARKTGKQTELPKKVTGKGRTKSLAMGKIDHRVLFEQARDAIAMINESHQLVDANARFASLFGYGPAEILKLYQWDLDHEHATREKFLAWWGGFPFTSMPFEARFRRKDGNILDVEVSYIAAEFEGGKALFLVCRDISKGKQLEASLHASELRFQLASWATKDVIWERDLLTDKILWNESLRKIFHFTIGEIDPTAEWCGQDRIHPDDRAKVIKSIQAALEQGQDFWSKEYRFRLSDDSYADIFDRGYILFNGQGVPFQMIGAMMDITYRKESEEKLDSERNLLSTLIDNLPDSVFVKDLNSRLILDNIAHRRLLGATRNEEVVGRTDFDFFPRELAEVYIADEQRIIQSGEPLLNHEEPVIDPQGNQKWLLTTKVPLRDRQGTITGIVGINHDITNRKHAEDALKNERAHLTVHAEELSAALRENEGLFSTVQDIMASTQLAQICQSLVKHFMDLVSADHITLYLVDHEQQEILLNFASENSLDVRPLSYQQLNKGVVGDVLKSGEPVLSFTPAGIEELDTREDIDSFIVVPLMAREGSGILKVIGVVTVINWMGRPSFTQHDKNLLMMMATQAATAVENIRLYEEAQRAREAADAANRSKSDFLANMSHEIRTPMNAILGLTQLVLDMSLDDLQRNYLQKVNTSSKALLGILNDILDYSKIEAGKLDLEQVDFDLEETLRNTAELFSIGAEEKEIELVFEIDREIPQVLKGDPLRLGQIFNNLVGNAIKFTEHGEIHIQAEMDRMEDGKLWLQFSVRDTGIGITKEQIERLFQAFSQADTSTTRKFGGTGLGLTISKRLVEMMGGKITVESIQGQGSTFRFTMPLLAGHRSGSSLPPGELHKMRTLVIDDQDASLQVMRNLLHSWSFDVTLASSGEEGLQAILTAAQSARPFELLLVDWKMHGLDGIELTRRIRNLGSLKEQPPLVVMVTAFNREDVLKSADAIHLDGVLEKPVTLSPLFDLLIGLQKGKPKQLPTNSRLKLFERTAALHGANILLVEDNPTNQLVARGILEKMALVVDIAGDGREAVDKITSHPYDLVLMDLQMPEMDGFEATRRIRSMPGYQNLPIIAMTAAVMQKDKEASHNAGMNAHIGKPIDVEELISVLMTWLPQSFKSAENLPISAGNPVPANHTLLKSTADFDLDVTLSWLGGDPILLKKILTSFQLDLERTSDKLHEALKEKNWAAVKSIAHKLNGTGGNMGAVTLQRHAAALEAELMEKPAADASTLLESIDQTLKLCKGFLQEMAGTGAVEHLPARAEINRVFDELAVLLTNNRLVPLTLLDRIQPARTLGVNGALLEKLGQQTTLFQYKDALLTLELIKSELELKS